MCKEMPVIPVNRVVGKKRMIRKKVKGYFLTDKNLFQLLRLLKIGLVFTVELGK
jgi:hypothetical protein